MGPPGSFGAYLEVPVGANGHPIEEFLIDPPLPVDVVKLGYLAGRGSRDRGEHVRWSGDLVVRLDRVRALPERGRLPGGDAQFRRVAAGASLAAVGEDRQPHPGLVLLHARAVIDEPEAYYGVEQADMPSCPQVIGWEHCQRRTPKRHPPGQLCGRLWWQDVVNGEPVQHSGRRVARTVGETTYQAWARPPAWRRPTTSAWSLASRCPGWR